jgi:hypothetical protein
MGLFSKSELQKDQEATNAREVDMRLKQGASFIGSSNDPNTTPTRDNAQTYPYDYFAGTDCRIFFGDIWVDDIATIQYTVSQSKTPIYGYASQNFDAIARGQVIVEGNLAIAFKETGYLNLIQAQLESQRRNQNTAAQAKIQSYKDGSDVKKFIPGLTGINENPESISVNFSATGSPDVIRQQQTIEEILAKKKGSSSLASNALGQNIGLGNGSRDFEDFAEVLEDSIWGDSNGKFLELQNKLKRVDEFDYNDKGGIITAKNSSYSDVLNIMLTFGDLNDFRAEHTIVVLNDVHFLTSSMLVSPDGNPIAEVYSFIARDINKSINVKSNNINIPTKKLDVGNSAVVLSKLEDIDNVQNYIENNNLAGATVLITIESVLKKDGTWEAWNYGFDNSGSKLNSSDFRPNKITPFIDQLSSFVEDQINNNFIAFGILSKKLSDYSQVIATANFGNLTKGTGDKITMILEQSISDTYTFKVISPVRSGFRSPVLISRDDFFVGEKLTSLKPPEQTERSQKEMDKEIELLLLEEENNKAFAAGDKGALPPEEFRKYIKSQYDQFKLEESGVASPKMTDEEFNKFLKIENDPNSGFDFEKYSNYLINRKSPGEIKKEELAQYTREYRDLHRLKTQFDQDKNLGENIQQRVDINKYTDIIKLSDKIDNDIAIQIYNETKNSLDDQAETIRIINNNPGNFSIENQLGELEEGGIAEARKEKARQDLNRGTFYTYQDNQWMELDPNKYPEAIRESNILRIGTYITSDTSGKKMEPDQVKQDYLELIAPYINSNNDIVEIRTFDVTEDKNIINDYFGPEKNRIQDINILTSTNSIEDTKISSNDIIAEYTKQKSEDVQMRRINTSDKSIIRGINIGNERGDTLEVLEPIVERAIKPRDPFINIENQIEGLRTTKTRDNIIMETAENRARYEIVKLTTERQIERTDIDASERALNNVLNTNSYTIDQQFNIKNSLEEQKITSSTEQNVIPEVKIPKETLARIEELDRPEIVPESINKNYIKALEQQTELELEIDNTQKKWMKDNNFTVGDSSSIRNVTKDIKNGTYKPSESVNKPSQGSLDKKTNPTTTPDQRTQKLNQLSPEDLDLFQTKIKVQPLNKLEKSALTGKLPGINRPRPDTIGLSNINTGIDAVGIKGIKQKSEIIVKEQILPLTKSLPFSQYSNIALARAADSIVTRKTQDPLNKEDTEASKNYVEFVRNPYRPAISFPGQKLLPALNPNFTLSDFAKRTQFYTKYYLDLYRPEGR